MKDKIYKIKDIIIKHRYHIVIALFSINLIFLDENNLIERTRLWYKQKELTERIIDYQKKIEYTKERLNELDNDSIGSIEKVAREKYFMKKPQEDIFIFKEDLE